MKRTIASLVATGMGLLVCLAWTIPVLAAEPSKTAEPGKGGELAASADIVAQSPEIKEAIARFKERDAEGALKQLKEAVKKDPDLPPAHLILAQMFSQANVAAGARNALEKAVIESPNDPEPYVVMGDIAMRERRIAEAQMLYEKAESLMPKFDTSAKRKALIQPRVFSGVASVDEAREDWKGAQSKLEAWLKLDPKSAVALQRLAGCLFQQKNPEGALEKLKEAAKADPEVLTPEAILARFYQQTGDKDNAKKWMAAALTEKPKDMKTRMVAAQWALETDQLKGAQTQAAAALQLDPKSMDAQILCGVIALFQKDYPAAERYFETAHLQSPSSFAANNNLALALVEQRDEAKKRRALEYAENDVRQFPKVAEAASTYGWVLYKLGRLDEAEKAFQAAVQGGASSPDTAYYIAKLSYDRGREAQAKQWLDLALTKSTGPFAMRQEAKELAEKLKK